MDLGLKGRTALVTGASKGIGRAIAEALAREGVALHLVARGQALLETAQAEIQQRYGIAVAVQPADLGRAETPELIALACREPDIVVNNAGAIPPGSILDIGPEAWRRGWDLKVFGYIDVTRLYYGRMQSRGRGVIVNIIGMGAEKLDDQYAAGSAGNAALAAFTRSVGSASLDCGVRVLGVSPGWVATERTAGSKRWRDVQTVWPSLGLIQPQEVADLVTFLASDRAAAMSGQIVTVDRGFAARSYPPA
jgi:NAD(P)-dependent dehydrogenase (short-subunit alcohol dehydrogenase family)